MNYDFHALLDPLEFQDLVCEIIQQKEGIRLESYREGRDLGIDGLYHEQGEKIIVQVKRYKQDFKTLVRVLKAQELPKVQKLNPTRYILCVSMDFQNNDEKQRIVDLF